MDTPTRRNFLGLAGNAAAAVAVGAIGARLIEAAQAMPLASNLATVGTPPTNPVTEVQWRHPGSRPRPDWGRPRPRRRRWVCWWHRGRRRCGWRW
jgi:hypothetical protein